MDNPKVDLSAPSDTDSRPEKGVLIVDDEPMIIRVLERVLRSVFRKEFPYKLKTLGKAENGKEALRIIQSGISPDVILSDMMMPEGTGKDLFDQLDDDLRERIIFMSGGVPNSFPDLEEFLETRKKAGLFLKKPDCFSGIEVIRNAVLQVLSGKN